MSRKTQFEYVPTAPSATPVSATADELAKQDLVIYRTRPGAEGDFWTPQHGVMCIPDGWEFLPRGDAFVTRRVKQGRHWVLMGRYNRKGGYTPVHGVYAPAEAIAAAQAAAGETKAKRQRTRERSRARRAEEETQYRKKFEEACLRFLDFAPAHRKLAKEIATEVAAWACQVSSGRVGRTSLLSLEDKAALAVRAYIRHRFTGYESNLPDFFDYWAEEEYREAKAEAQWDVDRFLDEHRGRS